MIVVEDYDIITPLGNTADTMSALYAGKSAVSATNYDGLNVSLAPIPQGLPKTPKEIVEYYRNRNYAKYNSPKTLFIYSIAKGDINGVINESYKDYSPIPEIQAKQIAKELGLSDCKITVSSNACAAGAAAIDTARLFLENGDFGNTIIFGFEQITEFTVKGFSALNAISPTGARPFDKTRDGMSLGEGSGVLVLKYADPEQNDVVVLGSGASNDANHRTGPSKTGDGLAFAIERALKSANLKPSDISAIKNHGTATPYNDAMEAKALKLVFGDDIPQMVSLKGAIGHLSGAGSMIEAVISAEMLKHQRIPATIGFSEFEATVAHGSEENISPKISVSSSNQEINGDIILCLSAGFGGINTAVILGR